MTPATASRAGPIRVLLVEDNAGDARLILEMLREFSAQFDLHHVDHLEPALEQLGRMTVDVVLLDLGLPDSQGLETFERTRRSAGNAPIIVISGLDDEDMALEAVRSGAQDYLVKGRIEGQLLARVIRYAIERKRGETKLRWLTLAVEQSPVSVFITDPTGTIEYVNNKFTQVTGYTPAEAIGQTPRILKSGLTPPEVYHTLWNTIVAGETWRGDIQNRRKSGELYWDSVVVSPIRDARGGIVHFLGVQEDITARKLAEQTLAERTQVAELGAQIGSALTRGNTLSEALNGCCEALVRNLDAAFARIWTLNEPQQMLELQASAGLYTHLDGPHSRVPVGKYKIGLIASERLPHLTNTVIGDPRVSDQAWAKQEGMIAFAGYPLLVRDRVVGVMAMFARHPFTAFVSDALATVADSIAVAIERKRAEEGLQESERRARTLFETVNLIVLGLDAHGDVNYVNPFFLKTTGYAVEEVLGKSGFELLPMAQQSPMRAVFRELVEEGLHPHNDSAIVTKAGEERMIAWNNTVLRDSGGRPSGTLSIGEDITARNQLEIQLRQAQKMEAVGRLAGGVAHDFNNVLTAVFGYVDLLREELSANASAQQDLAEIRKAAERAAGLTRQLLAFSRQQILEPVVLQINELVDDFEKMLRHVIGEDVTLRLALGKDVGNVRADPGQLHQVIMNLVVNARDAMPTGGKLILETANADLTEQYAELHQPVQPGRYVMLAVSDTGTGMSPEVKARIFEPFFTTKERGKGTGLGLSTVYGIVKQSGGYVWAYSEPGRGTTFKVYLPRVDAPPEPLVKPTEDGSLTGTETILLAEDDAMLRPLAKALLEKLGYQVVTAENAAEALGAARKHNGPIHLLVADVVMPGASGRELARRLETFRPETKVLYISGYTDDAIVHHGMLEPGLDFLQKPFTPAVLARKVRAVLDAP